MINIVITAGGTVENIDEIRKITNTSTGKLGAYICNATLNYIYDSSYNEQFILHYIISNTAYRPRISKKFKDNVYFYDVTNTKSVENTIKKILDKYKIDYFIHSMAISDFYTSSITSVNNLAEEIFDNIQSQSLEKQIEIIKEILSNPNNSFNNNRKVSSSSDVILTLKRNPKIISLIKKDNKDIYLVGFKLLKNVTEEELIVAANKLEVENGCDLVLANDLKYINEGRHIGLLIKDNKIIDKFEGKEIIANGLVKEMFKGRI